MPSVEPRPSRASAPAVNPPLFSSPSAVPMVMRYVVSTATATTLFAIGAHIIGPNRPRELSTCPTSTNIP